MFKSLSLLGLAGLAASTSLLERGNFDVGHLSSSPPPHNFGQQNYGGYNGFQIQNVNDVNILQFALMLEIQQTLFYEQGFSQFSVQDMLDVGLSETEVILLQNSVIIEQTHVNTIVEVLSGLGQQPLNQPEFYFKFNSPVDFIEQLGLQEVIATEAYLGAAPLISDKTVLGDAASIMCTEARQSSFVNSILGYAPFASAFETPLSIEQVVTLVAPFIVSIPGGTILQELGFNPDSFALPPLSVSPFQECSSKDNLSFQYSGGDEITPPQGCNQLYCAFSSGGNSYFTPFDSQRGCAISSNVQVGTIVILQVTVSESIDISQCLSAPQFINII